MRLRAGSDLRVSEFEIELSGSDRVLVLRRRQTDLRLRGNAVQFVLALIGIEHPRYLTRDALHRLGKWRAMSAESVGKQAARIVDKLNDRFGPLVEWELKTASWRFRGDVFASIPATVRQQARKLLEQSDWKSALRFDTLPTSLISQWAHLCASALADTTEGKAEVGYAKLLQAYQLTQHDDLRAITDVLATRAGQTLPRPHLPVPPANAASAFQEAAEARRLAAYARMASSAEWESHLNSLRRSLMRVIETGDTATQAILFNAMAILARRLGRIDEAVDCAREAIALAIFSGDLILIQNVSFNLGNIISGQARNDNVAGQAQSYERLLQLDIELRQRLNIGKDSAQAELLCAYLNYERGDIAVAQTFLEHARPIIAVSQQPYDIALYQRVAGLCLCAANDPQSESHAQGLEALETAIAIYSEHGNLIAAHEVARDRAACVAGKQL